METQPKEQEHINDNHRETEDTEPKDFLNSQQQHHGTENKKAYGYMDDKPALKKPNSMETQPSEQEHSHVKHMKIKQQEALESVGHNHYESGREGQGMLDDEDSALYFRPSYTDAISREDIALEHCLLNNNNTYKAPISILLFSSALKLKNYMYYDCIKDTYIKSMNLPKTIMSKLKPKLHLTSKLSRSQSACPDRFAIFSLQT